MFEDRKPTGLTVDIADVTFYFKLIINRKIFIFLHSYIVISLG